MGFSSRPHFSEAFETVCQFQRTSGMWQDSVHIVVLEDSLMEKITLVFHYCNYALFSVAFPFDVTVNIYFTFLCSKQSRLYYRKACALMKRLNVLIKKGRLYNVKRMGRVTYAELLYLFFRHLNVYMKKA